MLSGWIIEYKGERHPVICFLNEPLTDWERMQNKRKEVRVRIYFAKSDGRVVFTYADVDDVRMFREEPTGVSLSTTP